jgi:hypothetical protein
MHVGSFKGYLMLTAGVDTGLVTSCVSHGSSARTSHLVSSKQLELYSELIRSMPEQI